MVQTLSNRDLTSFEMKMIRCKCQEGAETLEVFYSDVIKQPNAERMISVFHLLQEAPGDQIVYWLLSHSKICLLSKDSHVSLKWVTVDLGYTPFGKFEIECRVPDEIAPWAHSYVHGYANEPWEAVEKIVSGMKFSRGWR